MDILEVQGGSSDELFAKAVKGVQGIIFCDNFRPALGNTENKMSIARRLVNMCEKAAAAKVSTVKKVVFMSRYIPSLAGGSSNNNILHFLVGSLLSDEGAGADLSIFNNFRSLHRDFEEEVRRLERSCEYVIVRAPSVVENTLPGTVVGMHKYHYYFFIVITQ